MKKEIDFNIPFMAMPEATCRQIMKIQRAASSKNKRVKEAIPSMFIVADKGSGVSSLAKTYEWILKTNHVYRYHGSKTYLELTFPPADSSDSVFQKFFASPKIAASIINRYYGVFLVDFQEYRNFRQLEHCRAYHDLLDFIDDNPQIYYVFHVNPVFTGKETLLQVLKKHLVIDEVVLEPVNLQRAISYMQEELGNVRFSKEARKKLSFFLEKVIDKENFSGYRSLELILKNIIFELSDYSEIRNSNDFDEVHNPRAERTEMSEKAEIIEITENMVCDTLNRITIPDDVTEQKMGFAI